MALDRWKALLGALKNSDTLATDERAIAAAEDFVVQYGGEWIKLLEKKNLVLNQDTPDDPFAVGSVEVTQDKEGNDVETFTALNDRRINRLKCLHSLKMINRFLRRQAIAVDKKKGVTTAEDVGKTPREVEERIVKDAEKRVDQVAGGMDDDDEGTDS